MKLNINKIDVWAASIKDTPGQLAKKLDALAQAGANLKFLMARRAPNKPGRGVVFVTAITGAKQVRAARKAGFKKSKTISGIRVVAADRRGIAARLTKQIANAGVNLRGLSAVSLNKRAIFHLAFDSTADANKVVRCLKQL